MKRQKKKQKTTGSKIPRRPKGSYALPLKKKKKLFQFRFIFLSGGGWTQIGGRPAIRNPLAITASVRWLYPLCPPHCCLPFYISFLSHCNANKQLSRTPISAAVNPEDRSSPLIGLSSLFLLDDFFFFFSFLVCLFSLSLSVDHSRTQGGTIAG